jgi:succinyl-diaminopimelate desuccinylase
VTTVDGSLLDAVAEHEASDLAGLTAALCAVPSVWPGEGPLADAIERRLRARTARLQISRVANNVVARTALGAPRRVVLGGHLDTVPANGNERPRRDGDVLHGLGAADMKGSLAVLLALAERAERRDPRFDLTLFWYEGEEVADEHNGLRHLFEVAPELVAGDLAVLCEPTGGWVEAGCQGTLHVRATFTGARAHSARPWMGENAIAKSSPALARLTAAVPAPLEVDGLEFRQALQVVRIEGGVANNVVPDTCSIVVNRRFAPSLDVAGALAETLALLPDADATDVLSASPGALPNLDDPLVAEFVGTLDLPVRPKLGWTDVARFAAHGIPALNYGAGEPTLAHTSDERVELADLERCQATLAAFCGLA